MNSLDEAIALIASVSKDQSETLSEKPKKKSRRGKSKSTSTPYKYPLIEVIWDDASTDNGWEPVPDQLVPELVTTVGFLVRETEQHILIANSYDPNHTNGRIQIPIRMVVSRKVLM